MKSKDAFIKAVEKTKKGNCIERVDNTDAKVCDYLVREYNIHKDGITFYCKLEGNKCVSKKS